MNDALHRPEPSRHHAAARSVDDRMPPRYVAERLRDGEVLMVTDRYATGAEILSQLRSLLPPLPASASYARRQTRERTHREASLRLLAPIVDHRLALREARPIGFLEELYPELSRFVLPFVHVQALRGAWSRYIEGVHLSVLGHRIHPFYGTYVPTRVSHLELFGTWLSQYRGPRERAVDVGTGCGVLALMLCKAGFERVLATDNNPNAVESVAREMQRRPSTTPIDLAHGDLLCEDSTPAELIVFNPPWTRGKAEGLLDRSLSFDDGLFERFFDQACARLTPSGRIVVLFSNVMQLVQPDLPHPILTELERGRLQLVQKQQRKVKASRDKSGQRRKTRERVEVWELAKA